MGLLQSCVHEVVEGTDNNTVNLTPALSGLLGDIKLEALIAFLGLVDEALFLDINASVNLQELVGIINGGFDFAKIQETALKLLSVYVDSLK